MSIGKCYFNYIKIYWNSNINTENQLLTIELITYIMIVNLSILESQFGLIHNAEDVQIREKGYNLHAFNTLISQRIGNHRGIPDTRNKL